MEREAERFWAQVGMGPNGCWVWLGSPGGNGYGLFRIKRDGVWRNIVAHRWLWLALGYTVEGQLDHLCRNRLCVRTDHLEAVTGRENTLRGTGPTAVNATKTECHLGHDLAGAYVSEDGRRHCRVCRREHQRRYKANRRAGI